MSTLYFFKTRCPTKLISQNKEISYTYDIHGNIKTKTETPINPKTNEPIYQSDNGLIGYRKSVQFFYSPNNELQKTIAIKDVGLEVQRTTTQYHYDAFGRRIAKRSKTEQLSKLNQRGELVRYPTALIHLRKTDKTTYQSTLMLWEGNRQIQEYTDKFVFTTVYDDESFEPVARVVQSRDDGCDEFKIYHYHNNHLGTPQELTDECGNVVWANYEFAWGGTYKDYYKEQCLNDTPIDKDHLQPLKFQGQFYDVETGLHYNRFRYYDSDVGMFIQKDPIGLLGGVNVYRYADNPVMWIDPFGLSPCSLPQPKPKLNTLSDKDFLTKIARRAEKKIGGTGPVNGSKKHSYADKLLTRYKDITKQRAHLLTEKSYLNKSQTPVVRGTKGSARPDVYDPTTGTIYDYKFVKNP